MREAIVEEQQTIVYDILKADNRISNSHELIGFFRCQKFSVELTQNFKDSSTSFL